MVGWDFLVNPIMREGGYVRYDGKTSTQLLRNCELLLKDYNGSMLKLHARARDNEELEQELTRFYGIGPVTANIFLRELRSFWIKSNPAPLPTVTKIAQLYGLDLGKYDRKTITFIRIEAGLLSLRGAAKKSS